jgi:transglutaminase-like putative cysteine protease
VTHNDIRYDLHGQDKEAENGYIDLGFERQVSLATQTVFVRHAKRVLTEAGVENASEVSIDWDPAYEKPRLHSLCIIRGGRRLERSGSAHFKVMQLESERSKHIYDGRQSAVHILEDVRQDDIIEYSYSITGFNPVFGGLYSDNLDTRYGVAVGQLYYKLLVPAGRKVLIRNLRESARPLQSLQGGQTVYEWRFSELKPLAEESETPSWYDPYPVVQVSEFASWKDVSAWAQTIFPEVAPAPSVVALAAGLRSKYGTPEDQALAAIRFVQDEVRYLGIEMGVNTHRPHPPAQVLAQRFGDCKDKSYLLCTLLRALGFEAWPVLTPSDHRRSAKNWLPMPSVFDHCTVHARVAGQSIWIDPTITAQRGRLADIAYPDYQVGLLVRPGTEALSDIALQDNGRTVVKETLVVTSLFAPARMHVETVFSGSFANSMRSEFRSTNGSSKLKDFQNYYSPFFKKLKADSINFVDDEVRNHFTVLEDYTIGDPWDREEGSGMKLGVQPFVISSYLRRPADDDRRMPYALTYPVRITEDIEVQLPEAWDGDPIDGTWEAPGFRLAAQIGVEGDRARYHYTYEATGDHVAPTDIARFRTISNEVRSNVSYELTWGSATEKQDRLAFSRMKFKPINLNDLYPLLYTLLGLAVFVTWVLRRRRRS